MRKIVTLVAIMAAIAFFVSAQTLAMLLGLFGLAMFLLLFPILGYLPISTVLLLTFVGFGAIIAWALTKRDLKPVLFPYSLLILPALIAAILIVFSPIMEFLFNSYFFLPFLIILLAIFVGLGAIVVSPSYRQDVGRVLKLIAFTLGAILFSTFLWMVLYLGPMWLALSLMPHWIGFMSFWRGLYLMPRVLTILVAGLIVAYLYWPGQKRGLFLEVLGPVFVLELALFLTINLMVL